MEPSLALVSRPPLIVSSRPPGTLVQTTATFSGPGRTLHELYSTLGGTAEKHANRAAHNLGLGSAATSERIRLFFGDGSQRESNLLQLKQESPGKKLEKDCVRLAKYALPIESANTQLEAFKNLSAVITRYPGVRRLFLRCEYLDGVPLGEDDISLLWDRPDDPACGPRWHFHCNFAAACIADIDISTMVEKVSPSDLGSVANRPEGLSVIERLLVASDCSGKSIYSQSIAVRYLAGILALPSFWLQRGTTYRAVGQKLLDRATLLLKDLGVDLPGLRPDIDVVPFDVDGVDLLCETLLTGMQFWIPETASPAVTRESWYPSIRTVLQLLRQPHSEDLLPKSWAIARADRLQKLVPSQYDSQKVDTLSVIDRSSDSLDAQSHTRLPHSRSRSRAKKAKRPIAVSTDSIAPVGPVFGQPLRENLKIAGVQISTADANEELHLWGYVPVVVATCGLYLKEHATEAPATCLVDGSDEALRELQSVFETPPHYGKCVRWEQESYTIGDICSIFRRYLSQMPDPVIPYEIANQLQGAIVKQPFKAEDAIKTYKHGIRSMPRANQYLLLYVLDLLSVFSRTNPITSRELSKIFRPGIMSHRAHRMSPASIDLSERVLEFLIEQQDWFMLDIPPPSQDEDLLTMMPIQIIPRSMKAGLSSGTTYHQTYHPLRKRKAIRFNKTGKF
ncbi:Rho GTPase activation protein [Mycena crocata]|nr:Rho GTPase activation protein [Mycena crocata]